MARQTPRSCMIVCGPTYSERADERGRVWHGTEQRGERQGGGAWWHTARQEAERRGSGGTCAHWSGEKHAHASILAREGIGSSLRGRKGCGKGRAGLGDGHAIQLLLRALTVVTPRARLRFAAALAANVAAAATAAAAVALALASIAAAAASLNLVFRRKGRLVLHTALQGTAFGLDASRVSGRRSCRSARALARAACAQSFEVCQGCVGQPICRTRLRGRMQLIGGRGGGAIGGASPRTLIYA